MKYVRELGIVHINVLSNILTPITLIYLPNKKNETISINIQLCRQKSFRDQILDTRIKIDVNSTH